MDIVSALIGVYSHQIQHMPNDVMLIDNAVRHGAAPVTVSAERRNGSMTLAVRDRGGGYPAEACSPGRTLDGGLGLAIVRAIARAHGGKLMIANDPQGGAIATLQLPVPDPTRVS